ncbi:Deoxyuridine 5'-triphosphate nucleotidohydrolase [anaerobic digester metagenome]
MNVDIISKTGNLPKYETDGAAAMDLAAYLVASEPTRFEKYKGIGFDFTISEEGLVEVILYPRGRVLIPTGNRVAIPEGYEMQVRPRSGLAIKYGITCLNTPGTIDSDYRGDIGVILINQGDDPFIIKNGDRIAQLVFTKVERVEWNPVLLLDETTRGEGGFGHTGK